MTETLLFEPTRAAGLRRLARFVPLAGRAYASTRNTDTGPGERENVSMLSAYVRYRLLTEEEVLAAVLSRWSLSSAEKFIQEVYWRGYFKGFLESRPAIDQRMRDQLALQLHALREDAELQRRYRQACEGETGIDAFDAFAKELVSTGYLHNHARMWFASIWVFTLKLPWELGADFTYRHFIDGDPASNSLSWRWVSGLHTRGKTYLARRDNIATYTNDRFQPKGLAREAIALEEPALPAPRPPRPAQTSLPAGRVGLLLSEEDLHPESLFQGLDVAAVAGANTVLERSVSPVGSLAERFAAGALQDGLTRAGTCFRVSPTMLPDLSPAALVSFAQSAGVSTLVTAAAAIGPVLTRLQAAKPVLREHGIELVEVRRSFDAEVWPHATRGFFALKERIPELLSLRGLLDAPSVPDDQLRFL